jgi:hypothetical protein
VHNGHRLGGGAGGDTCRARLVELGVDMSEGGKKTDNTPLAAFH